MKLPSQFGSPIFIAVCVIGFAISSYAQHGGGGHGGGGSGHSSGGGGFSGRAGGGATSGSSGGFHASPGAGFSSRPSSSFRPGVNSRMPGQGGYGYSRNSIPPSQRFSSYRSANGYSIAARGIPNNRGNDRGNYRTDQSRPAYSGNRNGYQGGDRRGHRDRYVYGYGGYPWLGIPYLGYYGGSDFDYPDDYFDNGDYSNGQSNYVTENYPGSYAEQPQGYDPNQEDPGQGYSGQPLQPYGYQSSPQNYRPTRAVPPPPNQPTVTLVFRDGRQQQIHNYILSRDTLTVFDARHQEIPVDQLDLVATQRLNKQAGISFNLPTR